MVLIQEEQREQRENDGKEISVQAVKEKKPRRPPHNYMSIVKDAHRPFDTSSPEKICRQLYDGVFLREKKQKYWVEQESNKNCFMLFARDLGIAWGGDSRYWDWVTFKESDNEEEIEVAVLKSVCWLEITGKFRTIGLAPGTVYEAAFVLTFISFNRWASPVKLSMTPPNGKKEDRLHYLSQYPKKQWVNIPIGEFAMSPENVGEATFFMFDQGPEWKSGMVVKGVSFRPKK